MKNLSKLSFFLWLLAACQSTTPTESTETAQSPADALPVVRVERAIQKDFSLEILANGKVMSAMQSQLQFKQSGIIEKLFVSNGMAVKAGQTLAELPHDQENLAIAQANQQVAEAQIEINDLLIQLRGKEGDTKLTEDLYVNIKDWDLVYARPNTFSSHYSIDNHKIFFNVCRANKLYIYDIATEQITQYEYPEIVKGESHFYMYDYVGQQSYIIKKSGKKYLIYSFDTTLNAAKYLTTVDFPPRTIMNGKLHQRRVTKENGQSFYCHYLIPINQTDRNKQPILLNQVKIAPQK